MKTKITTAVEITDSHLKILQTSMVRGTLSVSHCDIREIPQQSDTAVSNSLSDVINSAKIKPENIIASVSRHFTILRNISLPSHSDQEIEKMINLQVTQQIPYPKEDMVLDYTVLEKEPSGYSKILVTAVHKDVVNRYLKIFGDSNLHLGKLTLSSVGVSHWFSYYEERTRDRINRPTAVINIDISDTEICFCHKQKLLFARGIHFGAKDLNADNITQFAEQIGLTLMTYAKEEIGEEIAKIILVSNQGEVILLKEKLELEHKIPVKIVDPFENIPKKKDLKLPLEIRRQGLSLAVGLGLVFIGQRKLINLLPSEVADTRKFKLRRWQWTKFLILLLLTLGLAVFAMGANIYKDSSYLKELQKSIDSTKPKVQEIKERLRRLGFMKERLNPGFTSIDIVYELYNLTPGEVSFNLLYLSEDGSLTLQGVSQSNAAVNTFQSSLAKSSLFEDVTLQYATKRRVYQNELTDFKITCRVKGR